MKLEFTIYKKKFSAETEYENLQIEECFETFAGLLILAGYKKTEIENYIIETSEELKTVI